MPIYAYKCSSCGHMRDVLQKISDPPLSVCPDCGRASLTKQVTAAGFQLKGSGWYVTDFREGQKNAAKPAQDDLGERTGTDAAGTSTTDTKATGHSQGEASGAQSPAATTTAATASTSATAATATSTAASSPSSSRQST